MTLEQYERTKQQLLLLASLVNQTPLQELFDFVEFLEKAKDIGVGDKKEWEKIRGDTDFLEFLARRFIDIRALLPEQRAQKAPKEKRTTRVRLAVRGRLDGAGGDQNGTMTIDPTLGTISVRPEKKQSVYTRSIREIADFICRSTILGKR
jgi:hypothetical protein